MIKKNLIWPTLLALTVSAFAQTPPGGGGGIGGPGGGQDSNPWNPANWNTTYQVQQDGTCTGVNWVVMPGTGPQQSTVTHAWTDPGPWGTSAYNTTGETHTVSYTSQGTTTITIKWIGVGPAPSKVLVRVSSTASYGYKVAGSGAADNGLGSAVNVFEDSNFGGGVAGEPKLRYIQMSGDVGQIAIQTSASAQSTGPSSQCNADARAVSVAIADRATEVLPWASPTYRAGFNDAPVVIENLDPTHKKMNVGITYVDGDPNGSVIGSLVAGLWGPWNNPWCSWSFNDYPSGSAPDQAIVRRFFTVQEIAGIAMSGPVVLTNTLTVTDSDNVSRSADIEISIYAPQMFPTLPNTFNEHDEYGQASELVHRTPFGTTKLENTKQYARAITKQLTIGGSLGGIPIFSADSPLALALNVQFQYGVTATVTQVHTIGYNLNPGPDDTLFWIEKRNLWVRKTGSCSAYGPNGYEGMKDLTLITWRSSNKEDAEHLDHEYHLASMPLDEQ